MIDKLRPSIVYGKQPLVGLVTKINEVIDHLNKGQNIVTEEDSHKCPACGYEMDRIRKDETLVYKGRATVIKNLKGYGCASCYEIVWDPESYDRVTKAMEMLVNEDT